MIRGTENMKPGMIVQRGGTSVFIELPYYRDYLGVQCWRCHSHNTTFEVFKTGLETNCLSCARGGHPIPDHIREWVRITFRSGGRETNGNANDL